MADRKPAMQMDPPADDETGYTKKALHLAGERVPFNQQLDAGLYEKVRAMSFFEDERIADILERVLSREIEEREAQRGESYEILPPFRVKRGK